MTKQEMRDSIAKRKVVENEVIYVDFKTRHIVSRVRDSDSLDAQLRAMLALQIIFARQPKELAEINKAIHDRMKKLGLK